jgi:small subunit ribosomal protein S17
MTTEHERPRIKSQLGMVVSDKMDKTVVVTVEHMTRHRVYHKTVRRTKRYLAHDDRLDARVGDLVRIVEARPLSRNKRWRVAEIVQKGEGAEIAPREIDSQYIGKHRERKPAAEEPATTEGAVSPAATETPAAVAATDEAPAVEPTQAEAAADEAPPAVVATGDEDEAAGGDESGEEQSPA